MFLLNPEAVEEQIHKPGFTPSDAAPQVDTPDDTVAIEEAQQTATLLAMVEVIMHPLQFAGSGVVFLQSGGVGQLFVDEHGVTDA